MIWKAITVSICLLVLLSACNGGTARRSAELLAEDYQTMQDAELQTYYHELSDQLARESRRSRTKEETALASPRDEGASVAEREGLLRERWNRVRQELRHRELLP